MYLSHLLVPSLPLNPTSSSSGGPMQVLGASSCLLYQATKEGHALLIGGCPPLLLLVGVPPPSTSCMWCVVGGCPPFHLLVRATPPSSPAKDAHARMLLGG